MHRNRWRLGLRPRPHWGSLQRSPRPPSWFKGATSKGPTSKGRGWEGREREAIVALWQANRQIIDFKIWRTKIFKLNFLHFWLKNFSKIFRERRGVDYLSICKFKKKSIEDKFFFRKFGWGAIAPQGVPKFEKRLRCFDRGARALSNAVKIVALRSTSPEILEF